MAEEPRARVVGMPRIEGGEVVFDVRFDGSSGKTELVRATTKSRGVVLIPFFGLAEETIAAARGEVLRWMNDRRHLMDSLYARLAAARRGQAIGSQVRRTPSTPGQPCADPVDGACTLCAGTGEVERIAAGADGLPSWAFLPKTGGLSVARMANVFPCPACRRTEYEENIGRTAPSGGLAAELERLGAVVSGRTATIRERAKVSTAAEQSPKSSESRRK
jgi:hypothetical protein